MEITSNKPPPLRFRNFITIKFIILTIPNLKSLLQPGEMKSQSDVSEGPSVQWENQPELSEKSFGQWESQSELFDISSEQWEMIRGKKFLIKGN